uniref:Ubiquitin like 3 n=1 Tax=Cyprinus carpio carpio TaxID=630221 RepID=A0A9J7Y7A5_CYPCA
MCTTTGQWIICAADKSESDRVVILHRARFHSLYADLKSMTVLKDWEEEQVSSPNILRLIYQGRFLHGNVTLGALKLPFGKTTVMHLVARETLPEPNSQGQRNREKTGESNCCVIL